MATPQKENGYTPIANEILDVIARTRFPGGERQVLDVILRKTYGYNKKEDQIAFTQFMEMTGLSRRTIVYCTQNLQAKAVIFLTRKRNALQNDPNTYSFNKNYESWVVQNSAPSVQANRKQAKKGSAKRRKGVVQNSGGSAKPMQKVVQNSDQKLNSFAPTKDKRQLQKTIAARKRAGVVKKEVTFNALGAEVIEAFVQVDPKNKNYYGNTNQREACDFLIEEYTLAKVLQVIKLLPKTNKVTYFPKIYTPCALRDSWQSLSDAFARMKNEPSRGRGLEE